MLNNLLKGIEPISSILIQDSLASSGSGLLLAFIQETTIRLSNHHVHVVCFERPPALIKDQLCLEGSGNPVEFYDYCTDHRGWRNESASNEVSDLSSVKLDTKSKNVLIVDSLSTLLSRKGFHQTYQQLHEIIQTETQLVCLVHEDFLPDSSLSIAKLRHLFSTCLRITSSLNNAENLSAVSTHVKKGGKVVRGIEEYSIDSDNKVIFHVIVVKKKDIGRPVNVDTIPKELTTFKLDLVDNEKVARDKLVLPYLRPEGGGGKVFYEPDDADDWDEEDPDDDLDV